MENLLDTVPPHFIGTLPKDIDMLCDREIPLAMPLDAVDDKGSTTVVYREMKKTINCFTEEWSRSWTATDAAGNRAVHTQHIRVFCTPWVPQTTVCQGDILILEGMGCYRDTRVMLFDTQGNKVFEVIGYDNGRKAFRGLADYRNPDCKDYLKPGMYSYYMELRPGPKGEGMFTKMGWIQLVRKPPSGSLR